MPKYNVERSGGGRRVEITDEIGLVVFTRSGNEPMSDAQVADTNGTRRRMIATPLVSLGVPTDIGAQATLTDAAAYAHPD